MPILFFCEQNNYQPNDVKEDGFTNLFSEDCNHYVTNSVSGDFSMPIYDEYEDEYLDVVHKKPTVNFVISRPVRK